MNYITWNKIIGSALFTQHEMQTFLSIDKDSLIDAAVKTEEFEIQLEKLNKNQLSNKEKREYAWNDFLHIFINPNTHRPSKDYLFKLWSQKILESSQTDKLPTIFPFIALFIIPLSNDPDLSDRTFYKKVVDFLRIYFIIRADESINTPDMARLSPGLDFMWANLMEWAAKNDYIFSVASSDPSGRARYAQPFNSQLIFTASQRNRFKLAFYKAGLSPFDNLDDQYILSILSRYCPLIGITKERWNKLKSSYQNFAISIFQREFDSWDGMAIAESKEDDVSKTVYLGVNQSLLLKAYVNRQGWHFGLCASLPDASFGEDYSYVSSKFGTYSFTIDNVGLADETIWNDKIGSSISNNESVILHKQGDNKVKLSFTPSKFLLLEYSFGAYISSRKLERGRRYLALIKKDNLKEYASWINDNNGQEIINHPLSSKYALVTIESAISDAPASEIRQLHFDPKPTIELVDTFSFGISEDNATLLYKDLPIYFKITGVNVASDRIHAVFSSEIRNDNAELIFDEESNLFKLPVVSNIIMQKKAFQIYCNESAISPKRYRLTDFRTLNESEYNEIRFNRYGESDSNGDFVGLDFKQREAIINWKGLKDAMNREGVAMPSASEEYIYSDFILYYLSSIPRVLLSDFKNAINVLVQNKLYRFNSQSKWFIKSLVDNYFRLGFINYAYENGKHLVAINKPSLLLIPPKIKKESFLGSMKVFKHKENYWTCLFTGARTPESVKALLRAANSFSFNGERVKVQIESSQIQLLPQSIFILSNSLNTLEKFAETVGLTFNRSFYSCSLLESIASLEEYISHITECESENRYDAIDLVERIDYEVLANERRLLRHHFFDRQKDVVTYFRGTYREKTVLWLKDKQFEIDKHWGHLIGMKLHSANVLRYSEENHSISLPVTLQLPQLYARALTLITGRIPLEENWERFYEVYNSPWAKFAEPNSILEKLS